ncbi:6065_t:CDS:2 [Ambispora gerdemannii]|uniref:6065_t:CDS:1 n=1 Tax=Ambispora gerdemannii TaxID=144530 RepID=A0A9N9DRC8_9GLOM|nr:6065_t:CDS:2 [Ambispora gerdemannii]
MATDTTSANLNTELPEYPDLVLANFPKKEGETVQLIDGRQFGFMEYNITHTVQKTALRDNREHIILLIPGLPGSRFYCHPHVLAEEKNKELNKTSAKNNSNNRSDHDCDNESLDLIKIRLFVLERPGIGLSTFAKRTFLDFANDVKEFCVIKRIMECKVIAYSAGGPYGLALAHSLGNSEEGEQDALIKPLVTKAAIISGISPHNTPHATDRMPWKHKLAWWLTKHSPKLLSLLAWFEAKMAIRDPVGAMRGGFNDGPQSDRDIYENMPGVERMCIESMLEQYSRGQLSTECYEYSLWGKPWGFRLEDIGKSGKGESVKCKVWHGEEDIGTTAVMGRYLVDHISGCESRFVKEKGHMLYFEIWEEVIDWLMEE